MATIILRRGGAWQLAISRYCFDMFHVTLRSHGSHATWLPGVGLLVTDNESELASNFPYDKWLDDIIMKEKEKDRPLSISPLSNPYP